MYIIEICSFEIESYKVLVSDPSYDYIEEEHTNPNLMKLNLVIDNVCTGNWRMALLIREDEVDRNAQLVCFHPKSYSTLNEPFERNWKKIGRIGVDSGMAGVYDLKYYQDSSKAVNITNDPSFDTSDDKWFTMNTDVASKPTDYSGSIPFGVVSKSGYGDGYYQVLVSENTDNKISGIKIIFIDDKEKAKWTNLLQRNK